VAPPGNQAATEKTNINLYHSENPVYSPKVGPALKRAAKGKAHGVKLKQRLWRLTEFFSHELLPFWLANDGW